MRSPYCFVEDHNNLTKLLGWCLMWHVELKMNTTFKHKLCIMSDKGQMSIWRRVSWSTGNVGGMF